ncbi:hypothetical protein TNCV_5039011 [Trichonephila clavipes]|nr:hypothetical protein TNCV_5039011 [Trichonephila clavipes]
MRQKSLGSSDTEDLQDLTPITPAMILCDRPSLKTTRLDLLDARVKELIPGKDGFVMTVSVKTQYSILVRPLQRIFPLEASGSDFQKLLNPLADSSMKTLYNNVNLPQV